MTGYIYIGYNNRKIKHGIFKIGMTSRAPQIRAAEIRRSGDTSFKPIAWIRVEDSHNVELLLVESVLRYAVWKNNRVVHFGNDHFAYEVETGSGKNQMHDIAKTALEKTAQVCETLMSKAMKIEWAD